MTNKDIIFTYCTLHGIEQPVDTYAGWLRKGQQVRKGEKALFKTMIWHPRKQKESEKDKKPGLFMTNAAFFGLSQVEPVQQ